MIQRFFAVVLSVFCMTSVVCAQEVPQAPGLSCLLEQQLHGLTNADAQFRDARLDDVLAFINQHLQDAKVPWAIHDAVENSVPPLVTLHATNTSMYTLLQEVASQTQRRIVFQTDGVFLFDSPPRLASSPSLSSPAVDASSSQEVFAIVGDTVQPVLMPQDILMSPPVTWTFSMESPSYLARMITLETNVFSIQDGLDMIRNQGHVGVQVVGHQDDERSRIDVKMKTVEMASLKPSVRELLQAVISVMNELGLPRVAADKVPVRAANPLSPPATRTIATLGPDAIVIRSLHFDGTGLSQ